MARQPSPVRPPRRNEARRHARQLNPELVRLSAGLVLLRDRDDCPVLRRCPLGCLMGKPKHRHPSPPHGVLKSVAFCAIWRTVTIARLTVGPGYSRGLLTTKATGPLGGELRRLADLFVYQGRLM